MNVGTIQTVATLQMAVVGCDYVTNLGLSQLLNRANYINVLASVPSLPALNSVMETSNVDLVLIDAGIPLMDLMHICRELAAAETSPTVVVMGDLPFEVTESLIFAGVSAILNNGVVAEDIPTALRMAHRGGAVLVNKGSRLALMERSNSYDIGNRVRFDGLNTRERAVALGVAEGKSNGQLASELHVSEATVKLLVSNVMGKLRVSNRVQIAVVVTKARLV
ncbi:DNA-binding response regulator, NarL/FixJ family, contains REC and HTH domains [Arthrobacter alpinus]|uniref:DNA-binding response regulator, NarL/FixJ family, contains REC and HTH domains n=1 Tax=Arthrobacter alpinus TaxID=656366 RepID=A0A1H5FIT7_9MICC|nr:response regulator transcription factor [Arthrobacter alpinus]SEE03342.1 DNA-binding response regulator, NarL/FixJ family, contains REC and HTH domains [Arthrobacter alpinus]